MDTEQDSAFVPSPHSQLGIASCVAFVIALPLECLGIWGFMAGLSEGRIEPPPFCGGLMLVI